MKGCSTSVSDKHLYMKRLTIIVTGVLFLLLIAGIWGYLMFYGTPKNSGEVFSNLGFQLGNQDTTVTTPSTSTTSTPIDGLVDTKHGKLRQLTTHSVAGYISVATGSSSEAVRYVERGTGHIYSIDLASGKEQIISRTTIPAVAHAYFSPDGNTVAELSYTPEGETSVFVGTINSASLDGISLEQNARNISFANNHTVLYTVTQNGTTIGYRQDISTKTRQEVFRFNFGSIDVTWGNGLSNVYITTKPSPALQGFIYKVTGNTVSPIGPVAYGLSSVVSNEYVIVTYRKSQTYHSSILTDNNPLPLPILVINKKCTFDSLNKDLLWCGAPQQNTSQTYIDDWYKGTLTAQDDIWLINLKLGSVQMKIDTQTEIGHSLDILNPEMNTSGTSLFFKNKTDQTLWMYDLTAS